jgi:hypothetical protein
MRSTFLYYRKHHGWGVHFAKAAEKLLYRAIVLRNSFSSDPERRERRRDHRTMLKLIDQAWSDTHGGLISPPRPW